MAIPIIQAGKAFVDVASAARGAGVKCGVLDVLPGGTQITDKTLGAAKTVTDFIPGPTSAL